MEVGEAAEGGLTEGKWEVWVLGLGSWKTHQLWQQQVMKIQMCGPSGLFQSTAGNTNGFSTVTDWAQALLSLPVVAQDDNLLCPVKMVKALYQTETKIRKQRNESCATHNAFHGCFSIQIHLLLALETPQNFLKARQWMFVVWYKTYNQ